MTTVPLRSPIETHNGGLPEGAILNALPHALLVVDPGNRIEHVNSAAEDFFHASASVLKGTELSELVAFGSPLLALVDQVRRKDASVNEYSVDLGTPKIGTERLVDIFAAPLHDPPDRLLVIIQHRSVARMIERQFTHRAAARSVSGLASLLAHEIKNPLSGIRGAAQLLESGQDDEGRALTQLICTETDRICELVDRMEVFGDDRPSTKEPVNIHSVLDHVRRLAQSGFASSIKFEEQYDPSLPPLPGNRDQLIQALLNLVKNAAEAIQMTSSREHCEGRITLKTAFRPGVRLMLPGTNSRASLPLMITIEDNGAGVPDDLTDHLFDPFVTTKTNGSGLGLALVSKIVRDHGGIIECASKPGRTSFRLLMPLHEAPPRQAENAGTA